MRRLFFILTIIFATLFTTVACNKNITDGFEQEKSETELVSLGIDIQKPEPRAKSIDDSDDSKINNIQVFIFDRTSGKLENYGTVASGTITLKCVSGPKTLVAIVNAPNLSDISSFAGLSSIMSNLADNQAESLVMVGSTEITIGESTHITLPVIRLTAKVHLTKIVNNMELQHNKVQDFSLTAVYLVNVVGERQYIGNATNPSVWYNKMLYEPGSPDVLFDSLNDVALDDGEKYDTQHYFYCYPNSCTTDTNGGNWTNRKTRLVVEVKMGGTTYYYPITLPELIANTLYKVSLNITRPGATSPDAPLNLESAKFEVEVVEWAEGESTDSII